jgi:hypothetical protein
MIDLILLSFVLGVTYGSFLLGAKYGTLRKLIESLQSGWKQSGG